MSRKQQDPYFSDVLQRAVQNVLPVNATVVVKQATAAHAFLVQVTVGSGDNRWGFSFTVAYPADPRVRKSELRAAQSLASRLLIDGRPTKGVSHE